MLRNGLCFFNYYQAAALQYRMLGSSNCLWYSRQEMLDLAFGQGIVFAETNKKLKKNKKKGTKSQPCSQVIAGLMLVLVSLKCQQGDVFGDRTMSC